MIIEGEVMLDEPANLAAATLRVTLRDTSMADAPAHTVAFSEHTVSGREVQSLPFRLELSRPPTTGRGYTLAAEIRAQGHTRVEAGDFLNTAAVPWVPDEGRQTRWRISVQRIKA